MPSKPNRQRFEGLYKLRYDGLSIIYITSLSIKRQIVKPICRQIDKPYSSYAPYHGLEGLSSALKSGEYIKTYKPLYIQTIYAGYEDMLNIRFEGLICKV